MSGARRLGSADEDAAADYLLTLGWTLLGRRVKLKGGELDIVALDGDALVVVEVRSRAGDVAPEATITPKKLSRLQAAANDYVTCHGLQNRMIRYDLVAIHRGVVTHHRDAFRLH